MPENTDTTTTTTTEGRHAMPENTDTTATTARTDILSSVSLELAARTAGINGIVRYRSPYGGTPSLYLVADMSDDRQACTLVDVDDQRAMRHAMRFEYASEPYWDTVTTGHTAEVAATVLRRIQTSAMPAGSMVPTTASEAERMARALATLATWADGGERHRAAEDIARNHPEGELCGSYEALVCPTFGWAPRRSEERWAPSRQTFVDRMAAWEQDRANMSVVDRLEARARLYERGGLMNQAACDHIANHLESHKVPAVNDLLESIGWDGVAVEREYNVTVQITRTRTVTEVAYVTLTREATDEDSAGDMVDRYDIEDYVDDRYLSWDELDEDTELTDWEVTEVDLV